MAADPKYFSGVYTTPDEIRVATGKTITVDSGGTLAIDGTWKIGGTAVSASAAEINAIAGGGLSAAELGVLDGVTAGTVTASKAVVVDANKDIQTFRHVTLSGNLVTGSTTLSEAELGVLDGVTGGTVTASKALVTDANKDLSSLRHLTLAGNLITSANVGTPGTNCTAVEYGDAYDHLTVITMTAAALTPTIPADAEGAGAIIYTFPAGVYCAVASRLIVTAFVADTATNAGEFGLGSVIASGDVAVLSVPATFEDWITGQTIADVSSPALDKATVMTAGAGPVIFEAGDSHVVHFNAAGTWNATIATAAVTGTVYLWWKFLGA